MKVSCKHQGIQSHNDRSQLLARAPASRQCVHAHHTVGQMEKRTPQRLDLDNFHLMPVRIALSSRRLMCSPGCFHLQPEISRHRQSLPGTLARRRKCLGAGSVPVCPIRSSPFIEENPKHLRINWTETSGSPLPRRPSKEHGTEVTTPYWCSCINHVLNLRNSSQAKRARQLPNEPAHYTPTCQLFPIILMRMSS